MLLNFLINTLLSLFLLKLNYSICLIENPFNSTNEFLIVSLGVLKL